MRRQFQSAPAIRRIVAAHAVSRCGDYLYNIALVVFVFSASGSLAWVAAVSAARLIPAAVLAPFAGVLVDRFDRKRVAVGSHLLGAAVMLVLGWQVLVNAPMAGIALTAMLAVAVTRPAGPAITGILTTLVPPERRASVNSTVGVVDNTAIVLGPTAGAIAALLGPAWVPFIVNAATFVLAAWLVSGMRTGAPLGGDSADRSSRRGMRGDLRDGIRAALHPQVRGVVGWTAATYFLCGVQVVIIAPVSRDLLDTQAWGAGCLEAAVGVGGVLAAISVSRRPAVASKTRLVRRRRALRHRHHRCRGGARDTHGVDRDGDRRRRRADHRRRRRNPADRTSPRHPDRPRQRPGRFHGRRGSHRREHPGRRTRERDRLDRRDALLCASHRRIGSRRPGLRRIVQASGARVPPPTPPPCSWNANAHLIQPYPRLHRRIALLGQWRAADRQQAGGNKLHRDCRGDRLHEQ